MGAQGSKYRWLWPLAVGLAGLTLAGLECQYEPLPDQRRGLEGDLCRSDGECEPCHPSPDGGCVGRLICSPENPPRCRRQCAPDDVATCGTCGPQSRCQALSLGDGGLSRSTGACTAAPSEGQICNDGFCAGCLTCASTGSGQAPLCRRACDSSVDAGPPDEGITGPHGYCITPDRPETGERVLRDCCLFGQACQGLAVGSGSQDLCVGPIPGQPGSTCRPNHTCDDNAFCLRSDGGADFDRCLAAGGVNQPCKARSTCGPDLTCVRQDGQRIDRVCRQNCNTNSASCNECDLGFACFQVVGAPAGSGVCMPAGAEGESCATGGSCGSCLICGSWLQDDGGVAPGTSLCRRGCRLDIDAGPDDQVITGPHPWCGLADPSDGGIILQNCCPAGTHCIPFVGGAGAACF